MAGFKRFVDLQKAIAKVVDLLIESQVVNQADRNELLEKHQAYHEMVKKFHFQDGQHKIRNQIALQQLIELKCMMNDWLNEYGKDLPTGEWGFSPPVPPK